MARKRYNDEELRRKALELRKRGYSYREIARRLGCSLYKVWEILSSKENSGRRRIGVAELAGSVEDLSKSVERISKRLDRVEERIGGWRRTRVRLNQ